MSVPADRMAPIPMRGDPNKIMGLNKKVFWVVLVLGLILAWYIWKNSKANDIAGLGPTDSEQGLTAADLGGTPADNSFATNTDLMSIEEQIQQMEDALAQLEENNGGNGAGIGHHHHKKKKKKHHSPADNGGLTNREARLSRALHHPSWQY